MILGTAGSGKTTMAILRAAYLADPELPGNGRTLLLTYNTSLVGYIQSLAGQQLRGVTVENYHKFARGYLSSRGRMGYNAIANGTRRRRAIEQAVELVRVSSDPNAIFERPLAFFEAEIEWLMDHGVVSAEHYEAVDRIGRAEARLERNLRLVMWGIYQAYLRLREELGFRYDWNDLAGAVINELAEDQGPRRYQHIVIDEGQDLSPQMLRSLSRAIPADGTITFFGDVAQQIYGHRMSWRSAGLNPPRVWNFSDNYRNSREIAALGLAISQMPYYAGASDMVAPTAPSAAGPLPTLVRLQNAVAEIRFVIDQATNLARTQAVAILARTVRQLDTLSAGLPSSTINLREDVNLWRIGPRLFVGTYHSAKGLEFDAVLLPYLSNDLFPDPATVDDFGREEAEAMDGRLLYVGVTRARRALIISYHGELSTLLPATRSLYTQVTR